MRTTSNQLQVTTLMKEMRVLGSNQISQYTNQQARTILCNKRHNIRCLAMARFFLRLVVQFILLITFTLREHPSLDTRQTKWDSIVRQIGSTTIDISEMTTIPMLNYTIFKLAMVTLKTHSNRHKLNSCSWRLTFILLETNLNQAFHFHKFSLCNFFICYSSVDFFYMLFLVAVYL